MGGGGRDRQSQRWRETHIHRESDKAKRQRGGKHTAKDVSGGGGGLGKSPVRESRQGTRWPTGPRDCPQPASMLAGSPLLFLKYHGGQGKGSVLP